MLSVHGEKFYTKQYGATIKEEISKISQENSHEETTKLGALCSFFSAIKKKKRLLEQEGYEGYPSEQKNIIIDPESKPFSNYRSLAIIIEGSCNVINSKDNYIVHELKFGEHFGASDLLQIPDAEFMGDIYAGEKGLKIIIIQKPD